MLLSRGCKRFGSEDETLETDEAEESAVTESRLPLYTEGGVSGGDARFPRRMQASVARPGIRLGLVPSGHLERVKAGARSSRSARKPAVV